MNLYRMTCQYCDESWESNYLPQSTIYCSKCKDRNIKVEDLTRDKIDYYEGCKPFPEKKEEDKPHGDWPY